MSFLGIELNDVAIIAVADSSIVFTEPGCALVESGSLVFGDIALRSARKTPHAFFNRYWRDLSEQPLATGVTGIDTYADLAHAQLKKLWEQAGGADEAAFAVPSYWGRDQLALLLGISQELSIPVTGIAEIPIAATRRTYPGHELVHIEVCAHATTLSRILQDGSPVIAETGVIESLGMVSLQRSCAEYFSRRFLECSRFDPLHDAGSEQRVYDQLDEWVAQLARAPEAKLNFSYEGNEFTAQTSATQLADHLRAHCQPFLQALRSRLVVGKASVLQIDARFAGFPGVTDMLQELPACVVFALDAGTAARGLVSRKAQLVSHDSGFAVSTTLPWDQPPAEIAAGETQLTTTAGIPSHLVLDGAAYRLGEEPFRIGAESTPGDYGLTINMRHSGVSRRHCSIEIDSGRMILSDYSRFGTLLNGHRVDGSVVLQTGDVISIGDPPCELRLISETGPDGT
ncbi:MAG: hypothetical protein CL799_10405 [Chromatiales bacterium]|jgi:hypothetical protein|nr:hypothetical protein [Chromatiales bacterium]MDP6149610.1 FHA domain-containing protein [Gammaproteobacteria bacterium]MDP7093692.1 FHA domain-containing protein [Gammaproteobacteria bacterium]MDP7271485.1 FHA domain-containing protein [Gammaproteobacteria bacterium]HJP04555.1 FHA domain-containing protein [Gammaproteobacteria bacterium]